MPTWRERNALAMERKRRGEQGYTDRDRWDIGDRDRCFVAEAAARVGLRYGDVARALPITSNFGGTAEGCALLAVRRDDDPIAADAMLDVIEDVADRVKRQAGNP